MDPIGNRRPITDEEKAHIFKEMFASISQGRDQRCQLYPASQRKMRTLGTTSDSGPSQKQNIFSPESYFHNLHAAISFAVTYSNCCCREMSFRRLQLGNSSSNAVLKLWIQLRAGLYEQQAEERSCVCELSLLYKTKQKLNPECRKWACQGRG